MHKPNALEVALGQVGYLAVMKMVQQVNGRIEQCKKHGIYISTDTTLCPGCANEDTPPANGDTAQQDTEVTLMINL